MSMFSRDTLQSTQLYGIVDTGYVHPDRAEVACEQLCLGGIDLLQLRAKGWEVAETLALARRLRPIARAHGVPFIINDHCDIAEAVEADGLHVGQDDGDLAELRRRVGTSMWLGRSTHSLQQAQLAALQGADYIGFGPLHATATKPGRVPIGYAEVAEMQQTVGQVLPAFCIGGISPATLGAVLAAGARRVVMVSALLQADDVAAAVRAVKLTLAGHSQSISEKK